METEDGPLVNSHETILDEAERIVSGLRRKAYGEPAENHGRTAALWSAFLGVPITARQVCWLNILQKCSRDAASPKRDNLVDVAGYARNIELLGGVGLRAELCGAVHGGFCCKLDRGHIGAHRDSPAVWT